MVERFNKFSYLITEVHRCVRKIENDELEKIGLKGSYAVYFLALANSAKSGGLTSAELAKLCGRNKAEVSRAIADMTERGLIKKTNTSMKYRARIILTDDGLGIANMIDDIAAQTISRISQNIPPSDITCFYDTFSIICANLKKISEDGATPNGAD